MRWWINVDDGRGPPGETHGPYETHHEARTASHSLRVYDYLVVWPDGKSAGPFATEALAGAARTPGGRVKRRRLTHVHVHGESPQ